MDVKPRWKCSHCHFTCDDEAVAREHFNGEVHRANVYLLVNKSRIDDLLELRRELTR